VAEQGHEIARELRPGVACGVLSGPSKPDPRSKPLHSQIAGAPSGSAASRSRKPAIGVAITSSPAAP
jgi:hypothetical protein